MVVLTAVIMYGLPLVTGLSVPRPETWMVVTLVVLLLLWAKLTFFNPTITEVGKPDLEGQVVLITGGKGSSVFN